MNKPLQHHKLPSTSEAPGNGRPHGPVKKNMAPYLIHLTANLSSSDLARNTVFMFEQRSGLGVLPMCYFYNDNDGIASTFCWTTQVLEFTESLAANLSSPRHLSIPGSKFHLMVGDEHAIGIFDCISKVAIGNGKHPFGFVVLSESCFAIDQQLDFAFDSSVTSGCLEDDLWGYLELLPREIRNTLAKVHVHLAGKPGFVDRARDFLLGQGIAAGKITLY